jgi:hypothetical protein
MNKMTWLACVLILSAGIFGAGYNIGKGFYLTKKMSRTISVKGLAEQDVKSDLGIWEIYYREVGDDLVKLMQRVQHDQEQVSAFLINLGFNQKEFDKTQIKIEDRNANVYLQSSNQTNVNQRYVITGGLRIRSTNVDLIWKSAQVIDKLIQQGISIASDASTLSPNPSYYYLGLDTIRANLLSQATKSARHIADQFAKDSESKLGGIQRASQGVFQIMGRDTSTMSADWNSNQNALGSIDKKIRLVTTIEYYLK